MFTNVTWLDQLYYIIQRYIIDQRRDLCIFNLYTGSNYIQLHDLEQDAVQITHLRCLRAITLRTVVSRSVASAGETIARRESCTKDDR